MQNQNSIHCSASAACSNAFVQRHATDVTGILSGWDRMVVRGTLRKLYYARLHDEVTTDLKRRPEGMRIKHRAGKNTLAIVYETFP